MSEESEGLNYSCGNETGDEVLDLRSIWEIYVIKFGKG